MSAHRSRISCICQQAPYANVIYHEDETFVRIVAFAVERSLVRSKKVAAAELMAHYSNVQGDIARVQLKLRISATSFHKH
jgi:hypothetical protein